jgi:hypothetical protein
MSSRAAAPITPKPDPDARQDEFDAPASVKCTPSAKRRRQCASADIATPARRPDTPGPNRSFRRSRTVLDRHPLDLTLPQGLPHGPFWDLLSAPRKRRKRGGGIRTCDRRVTSPLPRTGGLRGLGFEREICWIGLGQDQLLCLAARPHSFSTQAPWAPMASAANIAIQAHRTRRGTAPAKGTTLRISPRRRHRSTLSRAGDRGTTSAAHLSLNVDEVDATLSSQWQRIQPS